jgi:hypothetical protein
LDPGDFLGSRLEEERAMSAVSEPERRSGWLTFAAVVMFSVGFLRIISAISYFKHSAAINDLTRGAFSSDLWAWGVWDLVIAALALFAGLALLGNFGFLTPSFGRVVAYAWAVLVIVQGFMLIGQVPWYSAGMMTLAGLVIYALTTHPAEEGFP